MLMLRRFGVLPAGLCLGWLCSAWLALWPALADDTLPIAVGQRGLWDTSVVELGQRGGIDRSGNAGAALGGDFVAVGYP
jgi:hypothetical protein